ncbi:hypothetical protein GCM10027294_43410 [Marinactinospora endophytica]
METQTARPPEGELIEEARGRTGMSQNAAARAAGISGTRWRQIVKGYGTASGVVVQVTGPAETVARMARVVGVTPEELEEAGRDDAADQLREIEATDPDPTLHRQAAEVPPDGDRLSMQEDVTGRSLWTLKRTQNGQTWTMTMTFPPSWSHEQVSKQMAALMDQHMEVIQRGF